MEPLASRMRPKTIDDIVGQKHILNTNSLLYKMIKQDILQSIILYGPPGTGKTTLAKVIANTTSANFIQLNATTSGKKDLEEVVKLAKESQIKTILFIDEIHRFNKSQQDYLLSFVEDGTITLIGATTENPYFEVNKALLSRSIVFELYPVDKEDIKLLILKALRTDKELEKLCLTINIDALNLLVDQANGDIRYALQILEYASLNADTYITIENVKEVIQKPHLTYDKNGNDHYDTINAFTKSLQGSDPDATLYYLAKMLESGEDIKFIARRLMVHASEDIGNADPMAIVVVTNCALAVERVGLPEAKTILAQAALYLALAPKSNSVYKSISNAEAYIKDHPSNDIPNYLKNSHPDRKFYKHPYNYPNHYVEQQYLPNDVKGKFYVNDRIAYEQKQLDRYNFIRNINQNK